MTIGNASLTVLGSVTMSGRDGDSLAVAGREGILLAALLVHLNEVVAVDRLVDLIWEGGAPTTARRQIQYCVHRLRAKFKEQDVPATIVTTAGGYLLKAAEGVVDGPLFERTVTRAHDLAARGEPRAAAREFRTALRWWRGPLLDGMPRPLLDEAWGWEEMRLDALEHCLDLELSLGEHRKLVGELRALVHANPLHEGFWRMLMLALYRSGRAAEALDVYQDARTRLLTELGAEPGGDLKRLEAAILADDQSVMVVAESPGEVVPETVPPPRQLPAGATAAGRVAVTAELAGLLTEQRGGSGPVVVNLTGMPGVGKSTLAVHVAHQVCESFPDGQLYLSFGADETAQSAVATFLRGLGVPGAEIPADEAERVVLYQRLVAGKRILLVLDDVRAGEQVRSLIPGSAVCAVLVTSRLPVIDADTGRQVRVGPLDAAGAMAMLRTLLGAARVDAEAEHAMALVRSVGALPLALRITAAKLLARPHWSLRRMADRLADQDERLDELAHGDLVVRDGLRLACEGLDEPAATLLVRLSRLDAPVVPVWVAAAVLDSSVAEAGDVVDRLAGAGLVDRVGTDRFRFHELVRIFAAELDAEWDAELEILEGTTGPAAVETAVNGWVSLAEEAHRALYGGDYALLHDQAAWPLLPVAPYEDVRRDPVGWLEEHRLSVCAAVGQAARTGLARQAWRLAVALVPLFESRGHHDDWQSTHDLALEAALVAGDARGVAAVTCSLGWLYRRQDRPAESLVMVERAQALFSEAGDEQGLAQVQRALGLLDRRGGDVVRAEERYRLALDGFARRGDVIAQADVLALIAQVALDAGALARAERELVRALELCRHVASPRVEARIRYQLGKVLTAADEFLTAERVLVDVIGLVRRGRDLVGESHALHALGELHLRQDDLGAAARCFEQAAALCEENRDRIGAARVWRDLSQVLRREGRERLADELAGRAGTVLAAHDLARAGRDW